MKELLIKGAQILFTTSNGKLKYYIKAVQKNNEWILLDSALHSKIALKVIQLLPEFSGVRKIRKEVQIGKSRIDFLLDNILLEVKGASLVKNKIALFPDAPTERGYRHVEEIIRHDGILLFLIFRKAKKFCPNHETDPKFASKLSEVRGKGIKIILIQINFDGETIYYVGKIDLADF